MTNAKNSQYIIHAKGKEIVVISTHKDEDYISLTDIAKYKNQDSPADVVKNWIRSRDTIEFLGLWEQLSNPDFKLVDFDQFRQEAGKNTFVLSPQKWIEKTSAIGLISKSGRYGGTYAHKDIAFEFASWVSPEFKLYIIKDYQRMKLEESDKVSMSWSVNRVIAKINYKIHTDAIKGNLLNDTSTPRQKIYTYADEADMLNVALFGITAKQWKDENPEKKGNIRDDASLEQLLVLANLENTNALFIDQGVPQDKRFEQLQRIAALQLESLLESSSVEKLRNIKS